LSFAEIDTFFCLLNSTPLREVSEFLNGVAKTERSFSDLVSRREKLLAPSLAQDWPNLPVLRAKGIYLYGLDGKRYMDFMSSFGVVNVGHNHPNVIVAAKEQMEKQVHGAVGVTLHESVLRLAEKLPGILPGAMDEFFFGNSGSEAVEGTIKLARNITKRPGVIAFTGSFHGRTFGAASLTASKAVYRTNLEPFLSSVYFAPYADPYHSAHPDDPNQCVKESISSLQTVLDRIIAPSQIATMIVEPIQGEGGYIVPPREFLQQLREICDSHDILLSFDEVWTGFGRTGEWFAAQSFGVTPDIMTIGKSIASGFPLSAVCARSDLMSRWEPTVHGTTFGGNPVSCAAAIATIQTIGDEKMLDNAKTNGEYLIRSLKALQKKYPFIGDVRGVGLMVGMEFILPGKDREPNPAAAKKVLNESLLRGLLLYPAGLRGHVIRFAPPLIVTKEQINEATSILDAALALV